MDSKENRNGRLGVGSWILYDLANTVFSMGVVSLFYSLWVREMVGVERVDSVYGGINSFSMAIIFFLAPILGAWSDHARRRIPFLVVSTIICVLMTLFMGRGSIVFGAFAFVIANVAYQAGMQFYDSLLPEVSTPKTRGKISGLGVGFGYLGSFIAVAYGLALKGSPKSTLFIVIALTFFILSIPCFFFVKERGNPSPKRFDLSQIFASLRRTFQTLFRTKEYPGLARFLIGRIFYTDAANTVVAVMGLFCINVALGSGFEKVDAESSVYKMMMVAICAAIPGGIFWGSRVDRWGAKRTLLTVLGVWVLCILLGMAIAFLGLSFPWMYVLGVTAGVALSGVWSSDRPLMIQLSPPERIGEFYGLYGMVGRFSSILGPALWGLVTYWGIEFLGFSPLKSQGLALGFLLAFILIGFRILWKLPLEAK